MTRLRDIETLSWSQLEEISRKYDLKLQYRKARCEHGKDGSTGCRLCSNGWVDDTSMYANLPNLGALDGHWLVATSDDIEDVAFISEPQVRHLFR